MSANVTEFVRVARPDIVRAQVDRHHMGSYSRMSAYWVILTNVMHNHPGHFDLRHSLTFALIHIVKMARIGIQEIGLQVEEKAYRLGAPSDYDPESVCQWTCRLIK